MMRKLEWLLGLTSETEDEFPEWAGWLVVAILLAGVMFALGVWYGGMLEIRT